MGRVVSVEIYEGGGKALFLRKTGRVYILEKAVQETPSEDTLRKSEILVSSYHPDLLMERVEVPPVKDPETLEVLIKKRLSESVGLSEDYLLVYRLLETQRDRRVYRVLGIPRAVYEGSPFAEEEIGLRVSLFTSSHLSLAGVSKTVAEDLTLFHVYADEEKLIMTVSRGDEVLYTRSVVLGGADRDAFLLEHVNMTYIFVAQRQNIPVDLILLSGIAKDADNFISNLLETVQSGIATPLVPHNLRNVGPDQFHRFLIPLGNLYLSGDYDFSPRDIKEKRWFLKTVTRSLMFIYPVLAVLSVFLGMTLYEFWINLKDYMDQREYIVTRSRAFLAEDLIREGKLDYYLTYVNLIYRSRALNPLSILEDIGPLLGVVKAQSYIFSSEKDRVVLTLRIDRTFGSLVEMTAFREDLIRELEDLRTKRGLSYRIEQETKDITKNRLKMVIRLERKV
jgi:hypothetical protein